MTLLTREQILAALKNGWGDYVARFQRLSAPEQAAFLQRQGYARLADLLAHVMAWWRHGHETIQRKLVDPGYHSPRHNVDEFNALAVQSVQGQDESEVLRAFETARRDMVALVESLPEQALQVEKINRQLQMDIVGHLEEHEIR